MSIWTPQDRVIRPPDFRGLIMPKQSAQPLNSDEIDYDDLIIHKSWRVHEPAKAAVGHPHGPQEAKNPGPPDGVDHITAIILDAGAVTSMVRDVVRRRRGSPSP